MTRSDPHYTETTLQVATIVIEEEIRVANRDEGIYGVDQLRAILPARLTAQIPGLSDDQAVQIVRRRFEADVVAARGMDAATNETPTVSIPMGRKLDLRTDAPRFWFHNPFGRGLAQAPIGIAGYPLPIRERELAADFPDADGVDGRFVYLAPRPLGAAAHNVLIDISTFTDRVRFTGQAEGYAIVHGDVPASAIAWVGTELRDVEPAQPEQVEPVSTPRPVDRA